METLSIQLVDISQNAPKVSVNKWIIILIVTTLFILFIWWFYRFEKSE